MFNVIGYLVGRLLTGHCLDKNGWVYTCKIDFIIFEVVLLGVLVVGRDNITYLYSCILATYASSQVLVLSCGFFMWGSKLGFY